MHVLRENQQDSSAPLTDLRNRTAQIEQFAQSEQTRRCPDSKNSGSLYRVERQGPKTEATLMEPGRSLAEPTGLYLLTMSPGSFATTPLPSNGEVTIGRSYRTDVRLADPTASGEHALLVVGSKYVAITDLGSKNGTKVNDEPIEANVPTVVQVGQAIVIGSTVLMVQEDRSPVGMKRLWTHPHFESRVEDECARARLSLSDFVLFRVRLTSSQHWTEVAPLLARHLGPPHVFAAYGPNDYEGMLVELPRPEMESVLAALERDLASLGQLQFRSAWYPRDGRCADALIEHANRLNEDTGPSSGTSLVEGVRNPAMQRIYDHAKRAATANINVLILGETGVGKEVLARFIHDDSSRRDKPMLSLNCGGLTESLLEAELFGHEKGAFTGAVQTKTGLLEAADGGTVFLDELGDMPMSIQQKLLRVLEDKHVRRIGALKSREIDVRFVAATNRDLESAVDQGVFRADLMYRLNKMTLTIPPLRERRDEIAALAQLFAAKACEEMGRSPVVFAAQALALMRGYQWPGNIRELKNVVERAVVLCDGDVIGLDQLPTEKMEPASTEYVTVRTVPEAVNRQATPAPERPVESRNDSHWQSTREEWLRALDASGWNQTKAARLLRIPRRTFVSKLDYYAIPRPQKS